MAEDRYDELVSDLTALGRGIDAPVAAERLATAVMDRVAALPAPGPAQSRWSRLGSRRRRIAVVVAAVLLALLATPPVRATVADWFGFGGVVVKPGAPERRPASPPPTVPSDGTTPAEAAAKVGFTVWVPAELGTPDGVEVSGDRRVVSMSWSTAEDGVLRLDQFDGRLDWTVVKQAPGVVYVSVGETDGLWFDEPHEVALLEPDGTSRTESARLAGQTLIWQEGDTTLRLEGELGVDRAVEIAESALAAS